MAPRFVLAYILLVVAPGASTRSLFQSKSQGFLEREKAGATEASVAQTSGTDVEAVARKRRRLNSLQFSTQAAAQAPSPGTHGCVAKWEWSTLQPTSFWQTIAILARHPRDWYRMHFFPAVSDLLVNHPVIYVVMLSFNLILLVIRFSILACFRELRSWFASHGM